MEATRKLISKSGEVFASPVLPRLVRHSDGKENRGGVTHVKRDLEIKRSRRVGREDERRRCLERIQRGFRVTIRLVMVRERVTREYSRQRK